MPRGTIDKTKMKMERIRLQLNAKALRAEKAGVHPLNMLLLRIIWYYSPPQKIYDRNLTLNETLIITVQLPKGVIRAWSGEQGTKVRVTYI